MKSIGTIRTSLAVLALGALAVSCSKTDVYDANANTNQGNEQKVETPKVANTFNFSTTQNVALTIDYSADKVPTAVFFSIYDENPLNVEVSEDGYETRTLKEELTPIYENYTNSNGVFNRTIELPSYAKHLYVLTGDFTVSQTLMEADVQGGAAKLVSGSAKAATRAAGTRAGEQTTSLETLWNISWEVDKNNGNKTDTRIYQDWLTPLGSWDKDSGRPSYVNQVTNDKLKFTEEEYQAVYAAATAALNVNKQCDDALITQADLQLVKDSEVGITMLGGNTCWHSTLGYYYYTGEVPTRENLHIIMLFPNTQDGHWTAGAGANNNYNGNIGVQRGDVVQLKYYPNIAQGDMETVSDIFPAGTKLGFILKANGWGMQPTVGDKKYYVTGVSYGNRKYNVWGASTDGLSYCNANGRTGSDWAHLNPNGESRTAKFQCTTPNNHTYAVVSFEDACNDKNYSDVIFSLKPMDAFQKLPDPEDKVVETKGVYCFEDLWPSKGDYDLNDCVVGFKHAKKFEKKFDETEFKVIKETFSLTTYQNFVTLKSGLALTLNTQAEPTSVVMKKVKGGVESKVNFTKDGDKEYLLTEDITGELGTEYLLELYYEGGISDEQTASVKPFIFRNQDNGKRWEVHIVGEAPTSKMDTSLFGTEDDLSDPAQGKYFVREGNYPFAFYLNNATVSDIARILDRANESKSIDQLFSGYMNWVNTGGDADSKWYKQ